MMNRGDICNHDQLQVCEGAHRPMHVPWQDLRDQVMSLLAHDHSATGHCHGAQEGNDRENQDREAASEGDFRHRWRIPEIHGRPGHHAMAMAKWPSSSRAPTCSKLGQGASRVGTVTDGQGISLGNPREPSGPQLAVSKAKVIVTRGGARAPREHSDRSGGSGGGFDTTPF